MGSKRPLSLETLDTSLDTSLDHKLAREHNPPSLPSLPRELWGLILNRFRDDKHTLSTCMRVSSEWSRLAAPVLYNTVDVRFPFHDSKDHRPSFGSDASSNPFHLPPKKPWVERSRKSTPKEHNLRLIRHATIHPHQSHQCRDVLSSLAKSSVKLLSLETLRFEQECNHYRPPVLAVFPSQANIDGPPTVSCGLLASGYLEADRVLSVATLDLVLPVDIKAKSMTYLVDLAKTPKRSLRARYQWNQDPTAFRPQHGPSHVIYALSGFAVLSNVHFEDSGVTRRTNLSMRAAFAEDERIRVGYDIRQVLRHRLGIDAWDSPGTKLVTIVNLDCIPKKYVNEKHIQDNVDAAQPRYAKDRFIIEFLTTEEYLTKYSDQHMLNQYDRHNLSGANDGPSTGLMA